jgi:hypothetical protein
MKLGFNNVLYEDDPHSKYEDTSYFPLPRGTDRIQVKPVHLDSNDYLYKDENADRFNSIPPSYYQESGQPKGVSPQLGEVKEFESEKDNGSDVFVDDFIKSSINEDNLIEEIKKITGGI